MVFCRVIISGADRNGSSIVDGGEVVESAEWARGRVVSYVRKCVRTALAEAYRVDKKEAGKGG
jgi:hypothetical protein